MDEFLLNIKRLNWVLAESTTGNLSYEDLSKILSELTEDDYITYTADKVGLNITKCSWRCLRHRLISEART